MSIMIQKDFMSPGIWKCIIANFKKFLLLTLFETKLKKKHNTCINAKIDICTKIQKFEREQEKKHDHEYLHNFNSTDIYFTLYHFSNIWKETFNNFGLKKILSQTYTRVRTHTIPLNSLLRLCNRGCNSPSLKSGKWALILEWLVTQWLNQKVKILHDYSEKSTFLKYHKTKMGCCTFT